MLCAVCLKILIAPKQIAGPKATIDERVYYDHHRSFTALEHSARNHCHSCTLVEKALNDDLKKHKRPSEDEPLRYWIEHWIPARQMFLLHFLVGDKWHGSLRILSPSRKRDLLDT